MSAAVVGTLAVIPAGVAFAQVPDAAASAQAHPSRFHRPKGLLGQALALDSLSPAQRSAIEQLRRERHDATVPVRQADARVLDELAQQVEQASVDASALAPLLGAEQSAATTASATARDTLNRLHALLTPDQRNQLVDAVEAQHAQARADAGAHASGPGRRGRHGPMRALSLTPEQRSQIAANLRASRPQTQPPRGAYRQALEAFRGDSFDAGSMARVERRGERAERLAAAMVPVLSPAQRATFAGALRARAAHESRG